MMWGDSDSFHSYTFSVVCVVSNEQRWVEGELADLYHLPVYIVNYKKEIV